MNWQRPLWWSVGLGCGGSETRPRAKAARRGPLRLEALEGRLVLAAPAAVADSYTAVGGVPLVVPAAGVLANDSDPDGDALHTSLVDNVDHGTLSLAADGGFTYTPTTGFVGTDTFQYRAVADPAVMMTVDQSQSSVQVTATLRTAFGNKTSIDDSTITGTIATRLTPPSSPFGMAQVTALNLTLADALAFRFNFTLLADIRANADAGALHVSLERPGDPAPVNANNFLQTNNELRVTGQANVTCTGIACGQVTLPPNPQVFDSAGIITEFEGSLSQAGSTISLFMPVNFIGTFDLGSGNFLDLTLAGTLNASGVASPENSNVATVSIDVRPRVDAQADSYRAVEDRILSVPVTSTTVEETLLPPGSLWKYLDNGSDQGTAWRATAFNDTAWKGPVEAEFGYGDGGEGTVIVCDPNPADGCAEAPTDLGDNFITSYFRRKVVLDQVGDIHELVVKLKRDDGAAVYINGVEVVRDNLPAGAAFNTTATGTASDDGQTFIDFTVPSSMLVTGVNVIAVEVHQASGASSDVSFDLELRAHRAVRGVLANDKDNASLPLAAALTSHATHGLVELNTDGSFTYAPQGNYTGPDSFSYMASDSGGAAPGPTTVTIFVQPVDDRPAAANDGPYHATVGAALVVPAASGVLANDSDVEGNALTATLKTPPTKGSVTVHADGGFEYTATSAGSDSFTYNAVQNTTLVPFGSQWRIRDDNSDQGTAWRAAAFDDSAWSIGLGQLGYGDGDETTLVRYGSSASNKYITTYFRRTFDVADASAVANLLLRVIRDDGVAVYVNGVDVGRDHLAAGAAFNTLATAVTTAEETIPVEITVDPALLFTGSNTIAVEIHQATIDSSDISFDLELTGKLATTATVSIESAGTVTPPKVESVAIGGAAWAAPFQQYLFDHALGTGSYNLPAGAAQLTTLPWNNLTTIALRFTELLDGANLHATLTGAAGGNVTLTDPLISSGPGGTPFAIWNVADGKTLAADRYTFTLDDAAGTTGGVALDGEWTNGASAFPSGNGTPGGDFSIQFRVAPGDVDRDGDVDGDDLFASATTAQFRATTSSGYSPYHDIDGNGVINVVDAIYVRNGNPTSVPSPAASAVVTSAPLAARVTGGRRVANAVAVSRVVDRAVNRQAADLAHSEISALSLQALRSRARVRLSLAPAAHDEL